MLLLRRVYLFQLQMVSLLRQHRLIAHGNYGPTNPLLGRQTNTRLQPHSIQNLERQLSFEQRHLFRYVGNIHTEMPQWVL